MPSVTINSIMLKVFLLSVVMLNAFMLSVVAPNTTRGLHVSGINCLPTKRVSLYPQLTSDVILLDYMMMIQEQLLIFAPMKTFSTPLFIMLALLFDYTLSITLLF
jgi:hypothetical protein